MPTDKSDTTKMTCPNCHRAAEVKITRHPTASPRHVDLTCECMVCGVIWEAALQGSNPMTQTTGLDPSDRSFTGLLVDYLRRMPASVANVASHFGMSEPHAKDALWSLEQAGLAHKSGRSEWSATDD